MCAISRAGVISFSAALGVRAKANVAVAKNNFMNCSVKVGY